MSTSDPRTPSRSDYRLLQRLFGSLLGGKVEHVPSEYDLVLRIFEKAGGSWEQVYLGSPGDIDLLKRVIRRAYKANKITKKHKWEPDVASGIS